MRQHLVVIRDGFGIACNAERARDIQSILALRQLPQPAEQALGATAREHDLVTGLQPQRRARQHRQLVE